MVWISCAIQASVMMETLRAGYAIYNHRLVNTGTYVNGHIFVFTLLNHTKVFTE